MRYLLALSPATATVATAAAGEPVVPWFPAPPKNSFLGLTSWKLADYAAVRDTDLDPDAMAEALAAQYPGLPMQLHRNYVLATAYAAADMPLGTRVRPIITPDSAALQNMDTSDIVTLWQEQPLKGVYTKCRKPQKQLTWI